MKKTTIYLPEELLRAIKLESNSRGCSEAAVIRSALEHELGARVNPPMPSFGLFQDGNLNIEDLESQLIGFGS